MRHNFYTVLRFLFSGGTAALFQLVVYIILSRIFLVQYLVASSTAFVLAVIVSFLLQKYVTFQESTHAMMAKQLLLFAALAVFNLNVNGILMVFLVEYVGLHDVLAQILCMVSIAVWSFFAYKFIIFRREPEIN